MTAHLVGHQVTFRLPYALSRDAQRTVLLETGLRLEPIQVLQIDNLTELEPLERQRLVDVFEHVAVPVLAADDPGTESNYPRVRRYRRLVRDERGWHVSCKAGQQPGDLALVFVAGPGRTVSLEEWCSNDPDLGEAARALFAGTPLVDEIHGFGPPMPSTVVDAYEATIELASKIAALAADGWQEAIEAIKQGPLGYDEERILFRPESAPPVGLLRESNPKAFTSALEYVRSVDRLGANSSERFAAQIAADVTKHKAAGLTLTDAEILNHILQPAAKAAYERHEEQRAANRERERYEADRKSWIPLHGSRRLKLAAQRGYRHDGIYRDERMAEELPGFVGGLARDAEIREVVNPSGDGLELEAETLSRVAGLAGTPNVRLVWARVSSSRKLRDGEYVEVSGYLGRHTVFRPVREDMDDDDIPF